jgi:hypothetical protein
MPQVCWNAAGSGEYWIDVKLGSHSLKVLVDTGLIDSRGQVGFSVDPALYDQIKLASEFRTHHMHARLTADGQVVLTESGSLDAQLISPQSGILVGPVVHICVFRGAPGVPDRAGLAFFHLLKGCKVVWDLSPRLWCIEYP